MTKPSEKTSHTRLIVASTLFALSILASFLFTYTSNQGDRYWVLIRPVATGVQLNNRDLALVRARLTSPISAYLGERENPAGSVTTRNLQSGEMLRSTDISSNSSYLATENISIAVRAADIPSSIGIGELVSLYQVQDARNGEAIQTPTEVISGVFVREISRKSANFGSDIALTISINRRDIPAVLQATASGRLVVASTHG
jgi:hypothetical protein